MTISRIDGSVEDAVLCELGMPAVVRYPRASARSRRARAVRTLTTPRSMNTIANVKSSQRAPRNTALCDHNGRSATKSPIANMMTPSTSVVIHRALLTTTKMDHDARS